MLLVTFWLQYLLNLTLLKQQLKPFYITGLSNLVHLYTLLPIADHNILHHWIVKFGPPIDIVTDRGSEYINTDMAHFCTIVGIRHSPRTPYSPWTILLVEVQNKNLGTHICMFLQNTPKDWAHQVHMYAFAHNSQPLSALNVSPMK